MSTEDHKAVTRRIINEVFVAGNLALLDELVAPDFVNHNVVGTGEDDEKIGVESYRQDIESVRSAVPDLAIDIIHLLADGDYIVSHTRSRGTHTTGNKVDSASMSILRFANGRLAERWNLVDRYGTLQQIGALPSQ